MPALPLGGMWLPLAEARQWPLADVPEAPDNASYEAEESTKKQQSCSKQKAAQERDSLFVRMWPDQSPESLCDSRMLKLVTVHHGGCHESVRPRADDIRYSLSAFRSCRRSRSVDAASRMVQQAGNESGCAASARSSLQVLLQQR